MPFTVTEVPARLVAKGREEADAVEADKFVPSIEAAEPGATPKKAEYVAAFTTPFVKMTGVWATTLSPPKNN